MDQSAEDQERRRGALPSRPPSEQLVDLHVYIVPEERWLRKRKLARNHVVDYAISAGFIRIVPTARLVDVRQEIERQLGHDVVPKEYVFLRSVGRNFTQVKEFQEMDLKAKSFLPPCASEPEIYLKSGQFADQSWSHGDDSGLDEAYLNARRAHEIIERRIGALSPPLSSPDAFLPHVDSTRLALSRPSKSRRAASNGAVAASAATTYQWNGADSGPYQHHRVTTTTTTTTHRSSTTVEEKSTRDSVHVLRRPLPTCDDERDVLEREGKPEEGQRQRALAATRAEEEDRVHEERTVGEGDGPELSDAPPAPSPGAFRRRSSVSPSAVIGGADAKDLPGAKDHQGQIGDRAEASPKQEHRRESYAEPSPAPVPRDRSSSDGASVITLALPTEAAGTASRLGGFQHRRPSLSDARRKSVAVVPVPESSKLSVPQQQRKLSFAGESVGPRRGGGDQDGSGGQRLKSQAESEEAVSQDIEGESERPQRRPSREAESRRASSVATLEREEESQVEQEADAETKPEADQEAKPEVGTSSAEEASIEQEGPAGGPASSSEEIVRSASEAERRPIEEAETDNGFRDGGREAGEAQPEGDSRYFREEGTYRFEVTQEEEQDEERAVAQTSWSVAPVGKGDVEEASGRQRTWKTTGGGDKASRRSKYPSLEREQQKQQQPTRATRGVGKKAAPAATRVTGMSGEKTVAQGRRRGQPGVTVQVAKVRLIPGRPVAEAGTAEAEAEASEIREYVRQGAKARRNAGDTSKKSRQTVANVDTARTVVESYRKSDAAAAAEAKKPKRERTFDVEVYVTELGDTGTQTGGAANISAKAAREHSSSRGGAGGSGERRRSRAQRSLSKGGTRGSLQGDRGQTKVADGDTTTDADGRALDEGATEFHSTVHGDVNPSADDTSTLENEKHERLSGDLPNGHHGVVQNTVDENISADDEGSDDENKTGSASRRNRLDDTNTENEDENKTGSASRGNRLDDTNTENGVQEDVLASEEGVKASARVPEAIDESNHADYQFENSEAQSGEQEGANSEPLKNESIVESNQEPPEANISDDTRLELNTQKDDDSYRAGDTIEHGSQQSSPEETGNENGGNITQADSHGAHEDIKLVGSIESHLKNPEIDGDNKTEETKESEVVAGDNNTADTLGDENSAIDTESQTASNVDNNGLTQHEVEPADAKENLNEDDDLASTETSEKIDVGHQQSTAEKTLEGIIDGTVAGEKLESQSGDGLETGQTEGSTEKDTMRSVVTVGTRPGSASATEPAGPPAAEHSGEELAQDVPEAADESEKSQERSTSVPELAIQSEEAEESQEIKAENGGPHEESPEVSASEGDAPDTVMDLNDDVSSEKVDADSQSHDVPTAESNNFGGDESKDVHELNTGDSSMAASSDVNPNINEEHVENSEAVDVPSEEQTGDDNRRGLAEDDVSESLAGVRDIGEDTDNGEQSAQTSSPSEVQDGLLQPVTDGIDGNTIPSEEAHPISQTSEPENNPEQDNYEEKGEDKLDKNNVQNPDISTTERITSEEAVLQELKSAIEENDSIGDEADNDQDAERKKEHAALDANSSIDTAKVGSDGEEGTHAEEEPNDNNDEPFSSDSAPAVKTEDESTETILGRGEGGDRNDVQDEERINDGRSSVAEGDDHAESAKDALKVDVNEGEATEKIEEGEALESEVTETNGGTGNTVDAQEAAGDLESDIERIMQEKGASPEDDIDHEEPEEADVPGAIPDMTESSGKTVDAVQAQEGAHGLETDEEHTSQEEKDSTTNVIDDSEPAKAEVPAATTDRATPPTDLDTSRAEEDSAFAEGTCTNTPSPATSRAELSSPKDLREGENNDEGILADEPPTSKTTEDENDGEGDGTADATSSSSGRGSRGTVTEVPLPTNIHVPQIRGGKAQTDSVAGGRAAKVKAPKGIEVLPPRFKPRPQRKAKDGSVGGIGGVRRVRSDGEDIDRAPVGVSRTALTTPEQRLDKGVGRLLGRHSRSVNMEEQGLVEIARLQKKLDALREERLACEAKREDLLRRAKFLQGKATSSRDQARDMWRRRYAEEKKVTPKLEEEGARWRLELERLHRELLAKVEGELRITGYPRFEQPSNKLSYKIMIAKVLQEIEDLKRRLEYTRISLGAEVRLRTHAEREVKNLREDLLKKKIQVTLTKKETQSVMAPFLRDSFYFVGPI